MIFGERQREVCLFDLHFIFLTFMKTIKIIFFLFGLILLYSLSSAQDGRSRPSKEEVRQSLSKLQKDTLYVINRTCKGTFSNEDINRLFADNYTFSKFRVLKDDEIYAVSKQTNVTHFALIGEYHTSENTTSFPGIYLLDKESNLCEMPYPGVTRFGGNYSGCIRKEKNVIRLLLGFNKNLERAM